MVNYNPSDRLTAYREGAQPLRDHINSQPLTTFYRLDPSANGERNKYNCPMCGSGTGKKRSGALHVYQSSSSGKWRVRCYACDGFSAEGQDTLGALCTLYKTEERGVFEKLGLVKGEKPVSPAPIAQITKPTPAPAPQDYSEYINKCFDEGQAPGAKKFHEYLSERGISEETAKRFKLGYDERLNAVVMPYSAANEYYVKRFIDPKSDLRYLLLKSISEPLFNSSALYNDDGLCFIVEGQFCAISIEQAGFHAVALCGLHTQTLIKELKKKPSKCTIALCLDDDDAGRATTAKLATILEEMGYTCVNAAPALMSDAGCKDPNEVLQLKHEAEFKEILTNIAIEAEQRDDEAAQIEATERAERTGSQMVDSFLAAVQTERFKPNATGIKSIDRVLGGGFIRQQLVLLLGAPGIGKTAMAQWLFESMAAAGTPCIYLNLEMSREQIIARSLSRYVRSKSGRFVSSSTMLQGYKWDDETRSIILNCAQDYANTIAPNMTYNPDNLRTDLDSIMEYLEKEANKAEREGKRAPVVVLDYLQLVGSKGKEDPAELIKRAVSALKGFAIKHDTLVFAIIANNRTSNQSGDVTMESGRDTSALEYSADIQLGLAYTLCLKRGDSKQKTKDELSPDEKKLVTLKVLKARFGNAGNEVDLKFDGGTMTYSELDTITEAAPSERVKEEFFTKPKRAR